MTDGLMVAVTKGKGPGEQIDHFIAAPGAENYKLETRALSVWAEGMQANDAAAVNKAQLELGIQVFGDTHGTFAALGTLAEHAAFMKSFSDVNTSMNNIGFFFALAQVARDAAQGKKESAVFGTLKAIVNYSIGRWGTGPMQIAGVATFAIDIALREWQAGVLEVYDEKWYCHYSAFYREFTGKRKINAWKTTVMGLYIKAEQVNAKAKDKNPTLFNEYLEAELQRYVHLAFDEGMLGTYGDCGADMSGYNKGKILEPLAAEYKKQLEEMLAEHVMPEVARYAWKMSLKYQIARANLHLKWRLNKTMQMEITDYDAEEGSVFVIALPNGGEWKGKLRDNGSRSAKITYYALMKAGFPEHVRIESPSGVKEREFIITDGKMTAVFGVPPSPWIVRYRIEEGGQTCDMRRFVKGRPGTEETMTRAARPQSTVDYTAIADLVILGHFDMENNRWTASSPGNYRQGGLFFSAPLIDDISSIKNCSFDWIIEPDTERSACIIERYERKETSATTTLERVCRSTAKITLTGLFASMTNDGPKIFASVDNPQGRQVIKAIRDTFRLAAQGKDYRAPLQILEDN